MDLLERASSWLETQRQRHLSRAVRYQRGNQCVEVPASVGKSLFELDDGAGGVLRIESRDYLVAAADLQFAGHVVVPQAGDRILDQVGEQQLVCEVTVPDRRPVYSYTDGYRRTLRVHTQVIQSQGD